VADLETADIHGNSAGVSQAHCEQPESLYLNVCHVNVNIKHVNGQL